jgi:hypothetical protein
MAMEKLQTFCQHINVQSAREPGKNDVLIAMGKAQSENAEDRLLIGICII